MTDNPNDAEALPALRELSAHPAVAAVWTELDGRGHRIWLARGANGHPWLLASDHLRRFRAMIAELADGAVLDSESWTCRVRRADDRPPPRR